MFLKNNAPKSYTQVESKCIQDELIWMKNRIMFNTIMFARHQINSYLYDPGTLMLWKLARMAAGKKNLISTSACYVWMFFKFLLCFAASIPSGRLLVLLLLKFWAILIIRWHLLAVFWGSEVTKQRNFFLFTDNMLILRGFSAIHKVLCSELKTQRALWAIKMSGRIKQAGFNYLN